MKKLTKILVLSILAVFLVAGSAQATPYVSTFIIDQADFSFSGFSYDHDNNPSTQNIATNGPDSLIFTDISGTYNLDIPPAGGLWNVYISGWLEADFTADLNPFSPDVHMDFDEYVGTYPSPGPSTSWGPGNIPLNLDSTLYYNVNLINSYPSGSFGAGAWAILTLTGDLKECNEYWTTMDNLAGGGDGLIDGWIRGDITVTAVVPEPATMLLLGSGLIGLAAVGRKKFFKKA